jgi:PIN domain nuclease of toxin-antitoxin system
VRLLLDTHLLLWWVTGDRRLSKQTRGLIASPGNAVAVSAASFWEIAIKIGLRRIEIDLGELLSSIAEDAFEELPVRANHTLHLASLPLLHNDPFDRLLIAQAIAEDCRLVTRDESVLAYSMVPGFDPIQA